MPKATKPHGVVHGKFGLGVKPDKPDFRDTYYKNSKYKRGLSIPNNVDWRSRIEAPWDQGQIGSCHDPKTEVLTISGWKFFKDITKKDKLASVCPETYKLIYERPAAIIKKKYKGKMYSVDRDFLNFKVTEDHKMLVRKWNQAKRTLNTEYELIEAKDLGWYSGLLNKVVFEGTKPIEHFTLKGYSDSKYKYQRISRKISIKTWMRFLGIYLAEGSLHKQYEGKVRYAIQLAAYKSREKNFIRSILEELGVLFLESSDRFVFHNKQIYKALCELDLERVFAVNKFVPHFVFEQSSENIKEFLLGHFMGDGSQQVGGTKSHYTSSRQLAEDLQTLAFLSGSESHIYTRCREQNAVFADGRVLNQDNCHPENRVSICDRKNLSIDRKKDIKIEDYEGIVYCAEVPTYHTLVTRRENQILISGNCVSHGVGSLIKYVYPNLMPSRLKIYYDGRVIENTVRIDSGLEIRDGIKAVVYGVCPEAMWPYVESKFKNKPAAACYTSKNERYITEYARVGYNSDPASILDEMLNCLTQGSPIVFGATLYESFESDTVAKSGIVPMPTTKEQPLGGHCMAVYGFDKSKKLFTVRNSWGHTDWGDKGYCYIPFDYLINTDLCSDMWMITK